MTDKKLQKKEYARLYYLKNKNLVIQFILHPIASYIVNIIDPSIKLPMPLDVDNL